VPGAAGGRRGALDAPRRGLPGFTEPALLAGLTVLVPMLHLLEHHHVRDLRRLTEAVLPGLFRRDSG
jgi:hypothetical protein